MEPELKLSREQACSPSPKPSAAKIVISLPVVLLYPQIKAWKLDQAPLQVPFLVACLSLLTRVQKAGQTRGAQKWHHQVKEVAPSSALQTVCQVT